MASLINTSTKQSIAIYIEQKPDGAILVINGVGVRLKIMPDIQFFHIGNDNRLNSLIPFWQKGRLIKELAEHCQTSPKALKRDSIAQLFALHDALIEAHLPPHVHMALKAMYRATGSYAPINEGILANLSPDAFRDIQNYKIAASVLKSMGQYEERMRFVFEGQTVPLNQLTPHVVANWRKVFVGSEKKDSFEGLNTYRALNKTLDSWRGKVPDDILALRHYKLEKPLHPMQVRLLIELQSVISSNMGYDFVTDDMLAHWAHIIQHSPIEEIRMLLELPAFRAMRREQNRIYFSGRKHNAALELLTYLRDGARMQNDPYIRYSSLFSMYRASFKAHEEQARRAEIQATVARQRKMATQKEWMETKTAVPPKELPEFEGGTIRFLSTVLDLSDESDTMRHCVYEVYSEKAVSGNCYIFHIEYQGEKATAELSPNGEIRQVKGIRNKRNIACAWGEKMLSEWARTW